MSRRDESLTFEMYDRARLAGGKILIPNLPHEQKGRDSLINAASPLNLATISSKSFKSLTIKDAELSSTSSSNNSTPLIVSDVNMSGYHRSTSSSTSTLRPDSHQKEDKQKFIKLPLTPQGIFK
jgi:hypothetical protein